MDRKDVAWAAGFFDGEGSLGLYETRHANGNFFLMTTLAQMDRRPLDAFAAIVGVGKVYDRGDRGMWCWRGTSSDAAQMLKLLLPFLRTSKQAQAILAIQFQAAMGNGHHRLSNRERAEKRRLAEEIRRLKKDAYRVTHQ